jgi:hypothetical protein
VGALGMIGGKKVVEVLINAMRNSKYTHVRLDSAMVLGKLQDKRAIEPLKKALKEEKHEFVRCAIVEALGKFGEVELLINVIKNEDKKSLVITDAIRVLGKLKDKRAVEPLIEALKNSEYKSDWRFIAMALGRIGDKRAIEPLKEALEIVKNKTDRRIILEALKYLTTGKKPWWFEKSHV